MFKKAWEAIKAPFLWIHHKLSELAPGIKTKVLAALGAIGSLAAVLQEFVSGLPLNQIVSATEALIITTVLFSLTFWARMASKT